MNVDHLQEWLLEEPWMHYVMAQVKLQYQPTNLDINLLV